jgi:DNA-binding MarR family transcriptional regulator
MLMGQFSIGDLILYALGISPLGKIGSEDKDDLAIAMGRSKITITRAISELKKRDLITKERYHTKSYFSITPKGRSEMKKVESSLSDLYLTTERHRVPSTIKMVSVLNLINNPLFKVFLINLYLSRENFDLLDTLKTFEILDNDTSIYNLFQGTDVFQARSSLSNFVHSFIGSTLYGIKKDALDDDLRTNKRIYETMLINAGVL